MTFGSIFELFQRTLQKLTGKGGTGTSSGLDVLQSGLSVNASEAAQNAGIAAAMISQIAGGPSSLSASGGNGGARSLAGGDLLPSLLQVLFRRDSDESGVSAPEPTRFTLPATVSAQGALFGEEVRSVDYGAAGGLRALPGSSSGTAAMPPIVVQIQALDSRSILDRSSEIAAAVRDAMLHSHSLNDLIGE